MRQYRGKRSASGSLALATMLLLATGGHAVSGEHEPGHTGRGAWMGVVLGDAVDGGVRVVAVIPGGPAADAGLEPGDLLVALAGKAATDRATVSRVLQSVEPGTRLVLRVVRQGELRERSLETSARPPRPLALAPQPRPPGPATASDFRADGFLGVRLVEMSPELRTHYGAPRTAGVLVGAVEDEALGSRAGLQVGDVLVAACGVKLTSASSANPCMGGGAGDPVLHIVRDRREKDLKLDLSGRYARAAVPSGHGAVVAEELRVRLIEEEIERLTARLAELRAELERLKN